MRQRLTGHAGAKRGDLLLSLNGRWAEPSRPAGQFIEWVAEQRPGTVCRPGIPRGGEGIRLDENALGFDTSAFGQIEAQSLRHQDDPRVPNGEAAILITDPKAIGEEMGVKRADLIVALDDPLIPAADAEETCGYVRFGGGGSRVLGLAARGT